MLRFLIKSSVFFVLLMAFLPFSAQARVDCPAALIENIQIEGNFVLYRQSGYPWRRLGVLSEEGTRERLSAMLAAQMSGKKVFVSYKRSDYNCSVANTSESAFLLRTYNQ